MDAESRPGRPGRPRAEWHTLAGLVVTGYLVAAAIVIAAHAIVPMPEWLALHLLVLGAATNAVFVWSQHFAQALLHSRPGSERPARIRIATLNAGIIAVLTGVSATLPPLAMAGALIVVAAVIAHTASLTAMIRTSPLAGPLGIVARYYVAAGIALTIGGLFGGLLASGWVRSAGLRTAIILAHAQVNLLGWLGLTIIGTQFMLWPMVLRTKMSDSAPRIARSVLALTSGGIGVAAAALAGVRWLPAAHWVAAAGLACYLAGAALSLRPAIAVARSRPPRTAAPWAIGAGNVWLIVALAADTVALGAGPVTADRVLGRLLVPVLGIGVVAQILTGALTFLLPVVLGGGPVGNRRMTAALQRAWRSRLILGNAGVLGLAVTGGSGWPAAAAWAATLAGFGSFPVLAIAVIAAVRTGKAQPAGAAGGPADTEGGPAR
jgi:nitrite reductase (NO-forming)